MLQWLYILLAPTNSQLKFYPLMTQRSVRDLATFLMVCGLSTSHAEGFDWTLLKGS